MKQSIPLKVKKTCCEMAANGKTSREIYNEYYCQQVDEPAMFESFKRQLTRWKKNIYPDNLTLESGTYEGFTAHDATVQVSKSGEIIQAWIKQKAADIDVGAFVKAIRESVEPVKYHEQDFKDADRMLEIPLFDMHWGVAFMDYYEPVLQDILDLINRRHWDRIVIPFGQDFFHNDSIVNGQTTRGTVIEKVDMMRVVREGRQFIYTIIDASIKQANEVHVLYSAGNHDRSISWMFMQVLLERYGDKIVDDSLEYRKVVKYGRNVIMFTHGDSRQATAKNLAHIFPISFPEEFADSDVREIHAGHLHHERESDIYGIMVRRLSTGAKLDDWSDKEDYIGTHRRFMVFEWDLDKLRSIHYI